MIWYNSYVDTIVPMKSQSFPPRPKLSLINTISIVSSGASENLSSIRSVSFNTNLDPQTLTSSSSSPQVSPTTVLGEAATEGSRASTTSLTSQSVAVITQSRASNSVGSSMVSSAAFRSLSSIRSVSLSIGFDSQSSTSSSSSPQVSPTTVLGEAATEGNRASTTSLTSQSVAVITQSRASTSFGSQVISTGSLSNAATKDGTTARTPSTPRNATVITGTTTNAPFTLTSSAILGMSTFDVSGIAVINGTQTMTQFVFLSMTRNLQNGTQSVAAPTSLPTEVGANNCNPQGGLICLWWWGNKGWGLCLSCTPDGMNNNIGQGTTITINPLPKLPTTSPSQCLFPFLCPIPPPGTVVQTVEGVENEPPGDQPLVDVNGKEDPKPSESSTTKTQPDASASHSVTMSATTKTQSSTTASDSSTSSASPVATKFAIYPESANYTATNDAFNSSLYQIADPSTVYVSFEEDMGVLFWMADLNSEQAQNLSSYGVSLSNLRPSSFH